MCHRHPWEVGVDMAVLVDLSGVSQMASGVKQTREGGLGCWCGCDRPYLVWVSL